jgi:hypothetical protein
MRTNFDILGLLLLELQFKVSQLYDLVPEDALIKNRALELKIEIDTIIKGILFQQKTAEEIVAMEMRSEEFAKMMLNHLGPDELGDDIWQLLNSIRVKKQGI